MFRHLLVPLAALALLGACATSTPIDPNDPTVSVTFGAIDMEEAPSDVDWVFVMHYDGNDEGYFGTVENGMFYHFVEDPGPYQIDEFGSHGGFFSDPITYGFGGSGRNESAIQVSDPGVYFMRSHRYVDVETGWFEAEKFGMETTGQPTEREILAWVLRDLETNAPEYVYQIAMVRDRLAQLN